MDKNHPLIYLEHNDTEKIYKFIKIICDTLLPRIDFYNCVSTRIFSLRLRLRTLGTDTGDNTDLCDATVRNKFKYLSDRYV